MAEIERLKRGRAGVTITALGTHKFSTHELLDKVVEIKTIRASKKEKGNTKKIPLESPEAEEQDSLTRAT
jgi:hypothetical protein